MLVTFRLSSLGYGGTERVFIAVADYLSTTHGWTIDFVVDRVSGHETENVVISRGYSLISLDVPRTWKAIYPFAKYLKYKEPDVVISAYTDTNSAALLSNVINWFNAPIIVTEHAPFDEHWAGSNWARKLMLGFMVRWIYKSAVRVVCVSQGMAKQLGKRLKHSHIRYIHNPVRFELRSLSKVDARIKLGLMPDIQMIIAVGRISKAKNYLMLLKSIKSFEFEENTHFYIIGGIYEQEEKYQLDQFVAEHGLEKSVHFIDFTHEVHCYFEAADLLVLSSAWEGFGNVLVEALAFGLPVVSTRCNYGPAEILADGEFGVLVAVNDHVAMAQAIQQVLMNNPFDAEIQIQRAQMFSEQRIGYQYYKLICKTLGETS